MILVTGGTGLVGAHLLYELCLKNDIVKATHRKGSNLMAVKKAFGFYATNADELFEKIEWVEADILDVFALESAFEDVTEVYHSAALISFNPKDYKTLRKTNIEGTANVVNFCIAQKVNKLCFVSSIAAVGKSINNQPISESNEWDIEQSNYGYAITKYGAEMEVWRASQEGIRVVIVNPGVILGAGFWKNGSGELFSKIDKGLNFYTEGVTGYVSVIDLAKVMIMLMKSDVKNERFILVAENRSFKYVFSKIAQGLKKKPPAIKISKLISDLGWRMAWVVSKLTMKPPVLTKQTSKAIHQKQYYTSEKLLKTLNFKFEKIEVTIKKVCELYLK